MYICAWCGEREFVVIFDHKPDRDWKVVSQEGWLCGCTGKCTSISDSDVCPRVVAPAKPGTAVGQDLNLSSERVTAARNFTNKLWNAGKFVLFNLAQVSTQLTSLGGVGCRWAKEPWKLWDKKGLRSLRIRVKHAVRNHQPSAKPSNLTARPRRGRCLRPSGSRCAVCRSARPPTCSACRSPSAGSSACCTRWVERVVFAFGGRGVGWSGPSWVM